MYLKMRPARTVSPVASGRVLPSSLASSLPSASLRSMIRLPTLSSTSARTSGVAPDQPGNAVRAASTALFTSSALPSGNLAITSWVLEGLVLSSAPGAEICLPPMKWVRVSVIKTLLEGRGKWSAVFKGLDVLIQPLPRISELSCGYGSRGQEHPASTVQKPTPNKVFHQVGNAEIPRRRGLGGGDPVFQHAQFGGGNAHHIALLVGEARALDVAVLGRGEQGA